MFCNKFNVISQVFKNGRKYGIASSLTKAQQGDKIQKNENILKVALDSIPIVQSKDWDKIQEFIFNHEINKDKIFNSENIDGIIMGCVSKLQKLDYAQSYLKYLESQNKKPNLGTIGRYLNLLYMLNEEKLSKQEEHSILQIYENIKNEYPVLDSLTLENMIPAVSLTSDWKKCLDMLQEVKLTTKPSTQTYSAIISAAFLNKNDKIAWDLLDEMLNFDMLPPSKIYQSYLKTLKRLKKQANIQQKLEELFLFLRKNDIVCPNDAAKSIVDYCQKSSTTVTVKFSGHCNHCAAKLEKSELTENQFQELKEVFFKNVMIGKDIFIKSDPLEMQKFQDFLKHMGQFDVVLDGLNIAYSAGVKKGPHIFSKIVASVVSHFAEQKKSILMLGRVHMARWPRAMWSYISENSTVFLTQNISQDDPYLLYCALQSGRNTIVVSRDLMRGHKFLLRERKYKVLFDRWLSDRQYQLVTIKENNKPLFRTPPGFSVIAQKNGNIWHIPYNPELDETVNEKFHKTWICVDFGKK